MIFLALISTIVASYVFSFVLYGQLPLPHLYHPNDFFHGHVERCVDVSNWHTVFHWWILSSGLRFCTAGFRSNAGCISLLLRYEAYYINFILIAVVIAVSVLNFAKIKDRFGLLGSIVICFLSAPLVFILSRMNLLVISLYCGISVFL